MDLYPILRVEDLFTAMSGGVSFSKLDLSHAYLQLQLEESSRQYVTINTHRGLYRYTRLPFGVSSAPGIFQRAMDNLLQGMPYVVAYLDDILISGRSEQEHLDNLECVLKKLSEAGMRLKREKCLFMLPKGIKPTEKKVSAITHARRPNNVFELRSFLGLINFYSKFLPNLSSVLSPLYQLLHKSRRWQWEKDQDRAFTEAKLLLKSHCLLTHYDCSNHLTLACDASPYGVGAVLSHKFDDGDEKPIAYVSRTLNKTELKYAQIGKESLAIIFGITKFHKYLVGRKFTIYTDHKPLMYLFGENKGIPMTASARVTRWALLYKPGKELANADGLSRLPLSDVGQEDSTPTELINLIEHLNSTPISVSEIIKWTSRDKTLSRARHLIRHGWPENIDGDVELKPYVRYKLELSVLDNCILFGSRVVVPPHCRRQS